MIKQTKEERQNIEEKLKQIGLNLENIPKIFQEFDIIKYRSKNEYDNANYKIYKVVNIKDIEIYLTPTIRLDETSKKYKLSKPLISYLEPNNEENIENYLEFLNMLKRLDLDKLKQLEKEQKQLENRIPYEVKYKDNFMWDIYYSEVENKYFMLFPTKETQVETLFYLIKQKIKLAKSKSEQNIYVPVNQGEYSYTILKKSEIADLENYLWFFTTGWPCVYEVQDKLNNKTIQVIGKVAVYDKIKSTYKFVLNDKEQAQKQFKLIKALFILQSNIEQEYKFTMLINQEGSLDFYYNRNKITYDNLPQFINKEIQKNKEKIQELQEKNIYEAERFILLEQIVQKQKEEYIKKEKQIVSFLECKKTFFGRVSYYFKSKKKKKECLIIDQNKNEKINKLEIRKVELEDKKFYTIEDLIKICDTLVQIEKEYKNKQMDIKALENKKENLERKIKNATLYINEIEEHKKSIFEFWKYTNKDEVSLLQEGEEKEEKRKIKIKKVFLYEEDIEDLAHKIDEKQRKILLPKEIDSIFAIQQDIQTFNILRKEKILKKDEKQIQKKLEQLKENYKKDFEKIKEKDIDIFGSVAEDKTKIKVLKNQKHREIQKDIYNILNVHLETTIEEYKDIINHYLMLLKDAYQKVKAPYDISIYQVSEQDLTDDNFEIFNINANSAIKNMELKKDVIILNKINVKENMPLIFYTNIMYYENINKTLPLGMDIATEVLIDLSQYDKKLVSRKDVNINFKENEFESKVKTIQIYEYDIERKEK